MKHILAAAFVFATLTSAHAQLVNENLLVAMPEGYKLGWQDRNAQRLMSEMVPAAQTVENWTEMVTVQIFFGLKTLLALLLPMLGLAVIQIFSIQLTGSTPAVALLLLAGIFLAGYTLLLVLMARSARLRYPLVGFIVVGNVGWATGCAALLGTGILEPNWLGLAFVAAQALAVLAFAAVEYLGLQQSAPAYARATQGLQSGA